MATGARGEGYLEVKGQEYVLFFNNRALAEAERALGKSMGVLANQLSSGSFSVTETADLIRIGINTARREHRLKITPVQTNDVYAMMDEIGFLAANSAVIRPLSEVLLYDPSEAEEGDEENPPE